jgi:hypothetical protein
MMRRPPGARSVRNGAGYRRVRSKADAVFGRRSVLAALLACLALVRE